MNHVSTTHHLTYSQFIVRLTTALAGLATLASTGCGNKVSVRPVFNTYDRVIIDTSKNDADRPLFTTLWMREFPSHSLVDWQLAKAQLNVQDLSSPANVHKARQELGVKGIVNIEAPTWNQLSITVVDTESATLSGSVTIQASPDAKNPGGQRNQLIERAIRMLANEARRVTSSAGGPAPATPTR